MSRPPRIHGFEYIGPYRYFLTFCTIHRRTTFEDGASVALVLAQFRRTARECSFATLAYCFMPDHVHFFVRGGDNFNLAQWMNGLKRPISVSFGATKKSRLWQPGFFDHNLRNDESYSENGNTCMRMRYAGV